MPTLLLKLQVNLIRYDLVVGIQWPAFHRWLPDGEKDAIVLDTENPDIDLKVWFERQGVMQSGLIEYKRKVWEVDPTIIPTQGWLSAGPLYGQDDHKRTFRRSSSSS